MGIVLKELIACGLHIRTGKRWGGGWGRGAVGGPCGLVLRVLVAFRAIVIVRVGGGAGAGGGQGQGRGRGGAGAGAGQG